MTFKKHHDKRFVLGLNFLQKVRSKTRNSILRVANDVNTLVQDSLSEAQFKNLPFDWISLSFTFRSSLDTVVIFHQIEGQWKELPITVRTDLDPFLEGSYEEQIYQLATLISRVFYEVDFEYETGFDSVQLGLRDAYGISVSLHQ